MWRIPMRHRYRILLAGLAFVLLALGLTWPLPLHLSTRLTGSPTGDTGVYVWNIWVFRHELLRHLQWPFTTDFIFALTRGTEMSVHNYTVFADVLALPLIGPFGVVAAFNLVYIALVAMSIINAREARRARERRASLESLAAVGLGPIRAQPLLTAGVLAAIVAANLVGSKRED